MPITLHLQGKKLSGENVEIMQINSMKGAILQKHLKFACVLYRYNLFFIKPEKTAYTFLCHQRIPRKMMSEKQTQIFHTDDISIPIDLATAWD